MARNDSNYSSDIDLLLIVQEEMKESNIEKMIPENLLPKDKHLSLSVYSEDQFTSSYNDGMLFIAHILTEGKVLYDDGFYKKLCEKPFSVSRSKLELNLKMLRQRLTVSEDLQKFNHLFIAVLSDFFSISKNLAYTLSAINGQCVFSKKKAFKIIAREYTDYRYKIQILKSLEPFYLRNAKGISEPLPFTPIGCEDKVIEIRNYINELINLGVGKID